MSPALSTVYLFGARTGGTNIIEGLIEISLGLFLAGSIATLFALFPKSIIGAMLLLVVIQLTGFVRNIRRNELIIMALTAGVSLATNMAIGFVLAVIVYHALRKWKVVAKYVA